MDDKSTDISPEGYDHFSYQNALASSMNYDGDPIYLPVENVTFNIENLEKDGNLYKVIDDTKDAYIEYSFLNQRNDFMFMYFDADDLQETRITVNDLLKQPYFTSYGWSIRELGYFPVGQEVRVRIYAEQDVIGLKGYEFYYENINALAAWYEAATKDKTELNKITSSHLKGKVNITEPKKLVFSFPYEDEWSVYIDGIKGKNLKAANGFLAVDIKEGEHDIELKYMPKGFILGLPVSIFFLIILVTLCVRQILVRNK
jgi:uncharacterized membrane protein YfhO